MRRAPWPKAVTRSAISVSGQGVRRVAAELVGDFRGGDDRLGRLLVLAGAEVVELAHGHRPDSVDRLGLLGQWADEAVVVGLPLCREGMRRNGVEGSHAGRVERARPHREAVHAEAGGQADQGHVPAALAEIAQVPPLRDPRAVGGHDQPVAQHQPADGQRLEQSGQVPVGVSVPVHAVHAVHAVPAVPAVHAVRAVLPRAIVRCAGPGKPATARPVRKPAGPAVPSERRLTWRRAPSAPADGRGGGPRRTPVGRASLMDLAGAVAEVVPVVEEGRAEAERGRRLPAPTMSALLESGLLAAKVPGVLGGGEADLPSLFGALESLSYADGSAAWITGFMGTGSAWPASRLDDEGVDELMCASGSWPLIAGTFVPSGRAVPGRDGYHVEGHWRLASGIHHASWVAAGCVRPDTGEQVGCVLPVAELTVSRHLAFPGATGDRELRLLGRARPRPGEANLQPLRPFSAGWTAPPPADPRLPHARPLRHRTGVREEGTGGGGPGSDRQPAGALLGRPGRAARLPP